MSEPEPNHRNLSLLVIALLAVVVIIFILNPTRREDEAALEGVASEAAIDRDGTLRNSPTVVDPAE